MPKKNKPQNISRLIALRNIAIIYRDEKDYAKEIKKYLEKYSDVFLKIIEEEKLLNFISQEAATFSDRNANAIYSPQLKVDAFSSVKKNLDPIFKHIIKKIDGTLQKDIAEHRLSKIKNAYNATGYSSTVSILIQNRLLSKRKVKKEYPDTVNFYDLDAELYESLDKDFEFEFDIQDKVVLDKLRDKANDISLFTPLAVATIYALLIEDVYFQKKPIAEVVEDLKIQIDREITSSAGKIATMDITYGADQANLDVLAKYPNAFKNWVSVGDDKVRNQHRRNEAGGRRKLYESFAGGAEEMSPTDCESPWNCRCSIYITIDSNSKNLSVWDGESYISM